MVASSHCQLPQDAAGTSPLASRHHTHQPPIGVHMAHSTHTTCTPLCRSSLHFELSWACVEEDEEEEDAQPKTKKETRWGWELLNDNKAIWLRSAGDVEEEEYVKFYQALSKVCVCLCVLLVCPSMRVCVCVYLSFSLYAILLQQCCAC